MTIASICNIEGKDTNNDVDDARKVMVKKCEVSNTTNNICSNDYVSSAVKILHLSEDMGYGLVTNADFKPNEIVYEYMIPYSALQRSPNVHSIQVGKNVHWCTNASPIRYTSHSCFNVNCKFVLEEINNMDEEAIQNTIGASKHDNPQIGGWDYANFKLVALQELSADTVVLVNYNSFEWEMSTPFIDSEAPSEDVNSEIANKITKNGEFTNGVKGKGRKVRGYKFAKPDERQFLKDNGLLLKHIEEMIKLDE